VPGASRMHHSDEFGKPATGEISGTSGWSQTDGRSLADPSAITLEGYTERELGITPPPPPLSLKALVIGLVVMFLVGIVLVLVLTHFGPLLFPPQ
jgi:hypothetical protein